MLSVDGHCKCLDKDANGYAKGEACVVVVLQKRSEAKRNYATIVHTKTNTDGFKELGITFPSSMAQGQLMRETYAEADINPNDIKFVDAHCTGTQAGDPVEMAAIVEAMCSDRKDPLLIGALKASIGHTEGASGMCSLTKVIFSLENECIPANILMKTPNPKIEGLMSGVLKPIVKNTIFKEKLVGLNGFGFGGANVHAIVRGNTKEADIDNLEIFGGIPRLVLMCGPNEESLKYFFKKLLNSPSSLTRDYLSLVNEISKTSPFKSQRTGYRPMNYRGFAIKNYENVSDFLNEEISKVLENKRQIWYVFSGLGSQWPAMAKTLMCLDVFAQSIKRSAQVLNEFDFDIMSILLDENKNLMDCPLNSQLSIASVQIGLVDVLNELDITPDGIVGHSLGELVCGYADGCLTQSETLQIAYLRGRLIKDDLRNRGQMAAIGLSLGELQRRLPSDVYIACHNCDDSFTVSGSQTAVNKFLSQLNSDNVFARPVDSTGLACHCPMISGIRNKLNETLVKVIPIKRLRSCKWLTTIYEESDEKSLYVSSDYFTDNMIKPVLFNQAIKQMPRDSIVIEVSAHPLMQSIVKRSLGSDITYIPLMKKNENNIRFLLESVGQLYTCGLNPSIEKIYAKVVYPVSRGTPALSPLVKWDHNLKYTVYQYPDYFNPIGQKDTIIKVDLEDEEDNYLSGHCIDGRVLFPATAYLFLAWQQLAKQIGVPYEELPVEFENVHFQRATVLPKVGITKFIFKILKTNGQFVISESGTVAVTGRIFVPKESNRFEYLLNEEIQNRKNYLDEETEIVLKNSDIYKGLRLRGYDYGNTFKCLSKAVISSNSVRAAIKWTNWISFADSMIQSVILGKMSQNLYVPVRIDSLRCDPKLLFAQAKIAAIAESPELPIYFDSHLDVGVTKGMEFCGVKATLTSRRTFSRKPLVEQYTFVAYDEECSINRSIKESVDQYMLQCYGLALKLLKSFNISTEGFVSEIPNLIPEFQNSIENIGLLENNKAKDRVFLQLLMEMNCLEKNQNQNRFAEEFKKRFFDLDNDFLNKCFLREEVLRPQLETFVENNRFTYNGINILEVTQSEAIFAQTVIQMIHLLNIDIKINYNLLHPLIEKLDTNLINEVECHHWLLEKSRFPQEMNNFDLVLYEDRIEMFSSCFSLKLKNIFDSLWNSVKNNGFLVVITKNVLNIVEEVLIRIIGKIQNNVNDNREINNVLFRKSEILSEAKRVGFSLIATKIDSISNKSSMIFRKIISEFKVKNQIFIEITNDNCEQWIGKLQNALKSIDRKPETENIWLLSDGCPTNGLIGFVNCLRKEPNGHRIRCIFNNDFENKTQYSELISNEMLLENIVKKDLVMNVLSSGNRVGRFTHLTLDLNDTAVPSEHCYLNFQTKGDLSSSKWFEAQHKYWPLGKKDDEQLIDVYYAPLNFRDIMLATGKLTVDSLPDDSGVREITLGLEFAGTDKYGNRVMGTTLSTALATTLVTSIKDFIWPIPEHWSMEEASTVPVVYSTAYYALIIRGKLKPREYVLIHSGSGGVGQAAISICLAMDCQLFITCGTQEKRDFLIKEFSPKLNNKNFCTSHDSSFESFVMRETNGRGVDVVLNSLSEDKLQASVRCLATNGRFLEIGKYDLSQNNELDLTNLLRNKTFHGIHLDSLFVVDNKCRPLLRAHKRQIIELVENGIRDGTVRPLNRTVYEFMKVEEAFRFMASGKHIGKVVIKIRDENSDFSLKRMLSTPRTVFKPNKSYIIIGGLGGFGLELANWMIEKGAMNLVLTSRTGLQTPYQKFRVQYFKRLGINVEISTKNVSNLNEAQELLEFAADVGSAQNIGGIFNLALVLSDDLFENLTSKQFELVLGPKAHAMKHLDQLTRQMCRHLDYFICFSSLASGIGNSEQSNYGFANSVMERVCEERASCGLPGLAIQWGPIDDVGFMVDIMGGNDAVIRGYIQQRMPSCLATLDSLLQMKYPVVSSRIIADQINDTSDKKQDLIKTISHILGLNNYSNQESNTTLAELGMDSLMTVEVKQTLEREYDLVLSTEDIRKLSIARIIAIGESSDSKVIEPKAYDKNIPFNPMNFEIPVENFIYLNEVKSGKPVLLLPPIGGSFTLLTDLAKHMKRPVIGLNWTKDCNLLNSFEETAEYYLNIISNQLKDNCYDLMGYSLGGCVAYEMAVRLQKKIPKISPKLIFLDSSPKLVLLFADQIKTDFQVSDKKGGQLGDTIAFLNGIVSIDYQNIRQLLENTRFDEIGKRISQIFSQTSELENNSLIARSLSNLKQSLLVNNYYVKIGRKFEGNCLLIRAEDTIIRNSEVIENDYGLSELMSGNCEVIVVKGGHLNFLEQNIDEITNVVNRYLE